MLPSLARREDVGELTRRYGQVIVDECHHLAAAAYDHSVKPIAARYWLGLTATPERRDGLGPLVEWQLGPVRATIDPQRPSGTLLDAELPEGRPARELRIHETAFAYGPLDPADPLALAALHHALVEDEARNAQIVADVEDALRRGRNCLVLTRRVAHVEALSRALQSKSHEVLIMQGGLTTTQRRGVVEKLADVKSGDGVLVVGTTPFIGEGFDAPTLDTLFLAGPISFEGLLVQCVGRAIRAAPGKATAEVHDYHDVRTPVLAASLRKRMPGYRALRFTGPNGLPLPRP